MARSPSFPFLIRQGFIYHARLDIPADVRQAFGGKRLFSRSTKLSDAGQAYRRAKPWLDHWKSEIEAARSGSVPLYAETLAREYAAETGHPDILLLRDVANFVARRVAQCSEEEWQRAGVASDLSPLEALAVIDGPRAVQAVRQITQPYTPFAARVAEFKVDREGHLAPKVLYEYCNEVE